jgi:hypothetical protein
MQNYILPSANSLSPIGKAHALAGWKRWVVFPRTLYSAQLISRVYYLLLFGLTLVVHFALLGWKY